MIYINENRLRIDAIKKFIDTYERYQSSHDDDLRNEISQKTPAISSYVREVGVATIVNDPTVGQYDLFENISESHLARPHKIISRLYSTLGAYEHRQSTLKRKLINPLYWIGEFIRIPFHILRHAGFDTSKIEFSFFGKTYKIISAFVLFVVAILQILSLLGIDTAILHKNNALNTQQHQTK